MAGYRFCRSDDAQRLVEAYNACYRVHFPELPELTLDGFKRWVREIQVWASSCMIAYEDRGEPIGVLIGAKRETANGVVALGVHPEHLRQGHGSHMLQSLSSKLAILGPPRILAEVPEDLAGARACFEACGFHAFATYGDFVLDVDSGAAGARREPHALVAPIGFDEALAAGLLEGRGHPLSWDRWMDSLVSRKERLRGFAVVSEARIEAGLLYSVADERGETCRIELVHIAEARAGEALVGVLFEVLESRGCRRVIGSRLHPEEVAFEVLERLRFEDLGRAVGYVMEGLE